MLAVLDALPHKANIVVDVSVLNVIVGSLIPLLVDVIAHAHAPDWVRAVLNLALAAVASVVTQAIAAGGVLEWRLAIISFAITFITSLAAYRGVWKPTGLAGRDGAVRRVVPAGIGGP